MPGSAPPDSVLRGFLTVYEQAEYEALTALADAVARGVKKKDRADLAAKATELTRLRERLAAITRRLNTTVGRAIPETLEAANLHGGRQAIADLDAEFGPAGRRYDSPINQGALDHLARSLSDTLTAPHQAVTRVVEDAYKRIIGTATGGVLTGTLTRQEATQRAMDEFAARGISGFTDRAGRAWQLSTYAEMAVRTATARASVDAFVERLLTDGVELGYISDSPQECGLCRPFEHQIVSLAPGERGPSEVTVEHALTDEPITVDVIGSLDALRALGLFHPNCTHSVALFLPGVTKLKSSEETANPEGYRDRQRLRALERDVRAAKRVEAAALDEPARKAAAARVRARQARIREHVKETGILRQPHREQLVTGDPDAAVTPPTTLRRLESDARRDRRRRSRAEETARERAALAAEQNAAEKKAARLAVRREADRLRREEKRRAAADARVAAETAAALGAVERRTSLDEWAGDVARLAALPPGEGRDDRLAELWRAQGYDALPRVVSPEEFDRLGADHLTLYRGLAGEQAEEWAEDIRGGTWFPGLGAYGNGSYTATDRFTAASFAIARGWRDATADGVVVRMALGPDARTITLENLRILTGADERLQGPPWGAAFGDPGRLATALGFDALSFTPDPSTPEEQFVVVLNRAALVVDSRSEAP